MNYNVAVGRNELGRNELGRRWSPSSACSGFASVLHLTGNSFVFPQDFYRPDLSIVQIRADDIAIHAFTPSDGSESAAIKVVHRQSGKEVINNSSPAQRTNLRQAVLELVMEMNPSPDQICAPVILLFDRVRVNLAQSFHDGQVVDLTWDYKRAEWKYFVECSEAKVTNWYVAADLDVLDD